MKSFDESKYMSFLIKDDKFLEKCNISDKVSNSINKKGFDSELVYKRKYPKTKIKSTQIFVIMECRKKVPIVFIY